ncbi:MAG TPA: hypothetical protein VHH73_09280 [Verrucomicrobiae bacterium]|nr:hypothetical protein [Verrucomicrobiae bacterium]
MSLIQFLSVNQTFKNVSEDAGPYQMAGAGYLPKFNEVKTAVEPEVAAATAPQKDLFDVDAPRKAVIAPVEPLFVPNHPVEKAGSVVSTPVAIQAAEAAIPAVEAAAPASPPKARRNGQGELSLDAVKVIRNDLSNTDVMVLSRPVSAPEPQMALPFNAAKAPAPATNSTWGRFVGRLFLSGRARS